MTRFYLPVHKNSFQRRKRRKLSRSWWQIL